MLFGSKVLSSPPNRLTLIHFPRLNPAIAVPKTTMLSANPATSVEPSPEPKNVCNAPLAVERTVPNPPKIVLSALIELTTLYIFRANLMLPFIIKNRARASPRASIALVVSAKANAFLEGRDFVIPQDIKKIIFDVLRHRIILTYEAEAEGKYVEDIITDIMEGVELP